MAKKQKSVEKNEDGKPERTLKFRLSADEQNMIQVAAAIKSQGTGEFAREIVLEAARQVIKEFQSV